MEESHDWPIFCTLCWNGYALCSSWVCWIYAVFRSVLIAWYFKGANMFIVIFVYYDDERLYKSESKIKFICTILVLQLNRKCFHHLWYKRLSRNINFIFSFVCKYFCTGARMNDLNLLESFIKLIRVQGILI